jgi:hypothetical protein
MPERVPAAPVQVTVHSILFPCVSSALNAGILGGFGGDQLYKFLQWVTANLLHCNKNTRTIANKRAFLHALVVSSTL